MVAFNSLIPWAIVASTSLAAPTRRAEACMTQEEAGLVAAKYGELLAAYTEELASAILLPDFTDYSESVNTLINTCPQGSAAVALPLLAPTFSSEKQFELGQGQQPAINFQQLQIWSSCKAVVVRWETTNTANITNVKPVIGLIAIEVEPAMTTGAAYPWLISTVYSEFDSGAWLQNLEAAGICASTSASSSAAAATSTAAAKAAAATATDDAVAVAVSTGGVAYETAK